jgi:hypothetical protein
VNEVVVLATRFEVMTSQALVPVQFESLAAAAQQFLGARNPRLARLDRPTLAALIAAHVVLAPFPGLELPPRPETLLVLAHEGSASADRAFWRTARDSGGAGASPQLFAATLPSAVAGELAMTFGLRGPCIVLAAPTATEARRNLAPIVAAGPCLVVEIRGWDADGRGEVAARLAVPGEPTSTAGRDG